MSSVGQPLPVERLAPPMLQAPATAGHATALRVGVYNLLRSEVPENTIKQQKPKQDEYNDFCKTVWPDNDLAIIMNHEKVYKFMYYQAFREQKPRGGRKRGDDTGSSFNYEEYQTVMRVTDAAVAQLARDQLPNPKKPTTISVFNAYKAVMRKIYKEQKTLNVLSLQWDDIWTDACRDIELHVKNRAPKVKKETYQEKVNGEFTPFQFVERFPDIENELWKDSFLYSGHRSIAKGLRNRYVFLHLTSGILRCESLHRAELSDFCAVNVPSNERDAHRMFVMVNQIPFGKTNHGRVLYGRATRHKDVNLCPIAAFSFYLQYRFHVTGEFEDFTVEDWCDNKKWFDVKLLVDVTSDNFSKEMKNDAYGKPLKKVLQRLGMPNSVVIHLGRKVGPKILELLEEESTDIQRLGNWNPSILDKCYSSKIPIGPIRSMAGFGGRGNFY